MPHDVVIRGGIILDGSGKPGFTGDVAIDNDRLAQVGGQAGAGKREIDATGLAVSPGFIDPHTHYDAQICWDPALTPSCWQGITTVVMGNCGFTIAPCRSNGRERLMRMLERVEGMSLAALEAGIDWRWESFAQYLDALAASRPALNVACLLGHSALRYYVLDEEATERPASDAELERMRAGVREAMQAGAFGFSTSQAPTHWCGNGKPVPSRLASDDEVFELGAVLREFGRGVLEITAKDLTDAQVSVELVRRSGRPLTYLGAALPETKAAFARARAGGMRIVPQTSCRPSLMDFKLDAGVIFDQLASWREVMQRKVAELPALFSDPAFRQRFRADLTGNSVAFRIFKGDWDTVKVTMTGDPAKRDLIGKSIAEIAAERGADPLDAFFDVALEDQLRTEFSYCLSGDSHRGPSLLDEDNMIGLSDAGAHLTLLADHAYTTYFLGRWIRERGLMPLEQGVRKLTSVPAELFGIRERGALTPGHFADVTIFDPARVIDLPTELVYDLPGGGPRLLTRAEGIETVIVNGTVTVERGELSGARSGQVLRSS
jgi:N-acyl-D-aspartate/D-glutamate deacylase